MLVPGHCCVGGNQETPGKNSHGQEKKGDSPTLPPVTQPSAYHPPATQPPIQTNSCTSS